MFDWNFICLCQKCVYISLTDKENAVNVLFRNKMFIITLVLFSVYKNV